MAEREKIERNIQRFRGRLKRIQNRIGEADTTEKFLSLAVELLEELNYDYEIRRNEPVFEAFVTVVFAAFGAAHGLVQLAPFDGSESDLSHAKKESLLALESAQQFFDDNYD